MAKYNHEYADYLTYHFGSLWLNFYGLLRWVHYYSTLRKTPILNPCVAITSPLPKQTSYAKPLE